MLPDETEAYFVACILTKMGAVVEIQYIGSWTHAS